MRSADRVEFAAAVVTILTGFLTIRLSNGLRHCCVIEASRENGQRENRHGESANQPSCHGVYSFKAPGVQTARAVVVSAGDRVKLRVLMRNSESNRFGGLSALAGALFTPRALAPQGSREGGGQWK
jgi:hypothetical protein